MTRKGNFYRWKLYLFICFPAMFQFNFVLAQIELDEEPKRLYYERLARVRKFKDMKDFRDVFHYNKFLLGKNRISGNISYNTGRVVIENDDHEKVNEMRQAIGFFTRIRFFEQYSFNTTFYKDFNPKASARWTSNYTYSLARYNWKPNKFNYGYENYLNNRYSDDIEEMKRKFLEGYYFVSFSHNVAQKVFKIDSTSNLKFTYFARYSIKYRDENEIIHGGLTSGKPIVGAGFRATLFWNIYVESAVYYYFPSSMGKQQPWDPDYSYGFGYFDWRSFRCSLTYGNWAVNRFPWNKNYYPYYGFLDGNFRFLINWIW
jgi:hypothetical protein